VDIYISINAVLPHSLAFSNRGWVKLLSADSTPVAWLKKSFRLLASSITVFHTTGADQYNTGADVATVEYFFAFFILTRVHVFNQIAAYSAGDFFK
jgi:hypothetical protein